MEQKQKSWFRRHLILTIILIFLVIGGIGVIFEGDNSNTPGDVINEQIQQGEDAPIIVLNKNTETISKDSTIIKKDPMDLLPTREEIDTEWENIKIDNQGIEASGFDSGADFQMDRMESMSLSVAYIFVAKFDSKNYADSFYSIKINKVKEGGGYTEISTSGIDATCFGYKNGDLYEGYRYTFYCKKSNIFFLTEVSTFSAWRSGYSKELAKIVAKKI